jgi:hypothetical protein
MESIKDIDEKIKSLQRQKLHIMHNVCEHTDSKMFKHTSKDYDDVPYTYYCIMCEDCGLNYTEYEDDSDGKYKTLYETRNKLIKKNLKI